MAHEIIKVRGPRTASVAQEAALEQLQTHPSYPKGAILASFKEVDDHWVAELKVQKEAAPAFFDKEEPAGDEAPDSKPPSEDTEAETPSEPEEKPKDEKKDGDEKSDKGDEKKSLEDTVDELAGLVHAIADKLGVGAPGEESLVPGLDDLGDVPPPEAPPGPPTHGPGPGGHAGPSKLKPGEVPNSPGVTPVGAPAFASTQKPEVPADHPFKDFIGKVATFQVHEPTDMTLREANEELSKLAGPYGYKVRRMREDSEDGKRVIRALISSR